MVLLGICVAGILLLFNLTLRALLRPVATGGRAVASAASATVAAARLPAEERAPVAVPIQPAAADAPPRWVAGRRRGEPLDADDADRRTRTSGRVHGAGPLAAAVQPGPDQPDGLGWRASEPRVGQRGERREGPPDAGRSGRAAGEPAVERQGRRSGSGARGRGRHRGRRCGRRWRRRPTWLPALELPEPPKVWYLPPVELLDEEMEKAAATALDHQRNVRIIEEKLRSFQIPASVVATNTGPVVTQYEVKPDARVKLSRIEALADDLAMALAARSIRIEAPIPGRDVVGIEIPNHSSEVVSFRALYEDAQMAAATSKLTFALGRDVSGKAYAVDLARMPHLLIAGATGSGKSVCVNALITSLLMRARPDEVNLVLIDLKRVELAQYDGLPHLKTAVIVEANHARSALNWAVREMEDRYKALAARSERNIAAFNASPRVEPEERLPYIVIVIDELADLIMREGRKVEDPIVKIAQKARAVGIHLVLATQRPSVNVVTGLIKANVPSRIAFAMSSNVDSRTVLDQPGAEDLIGRGDMLYQPADLPRPVRLQGVFVSDAEVRAVTDAWRHQAPEPDYDPALLSTADEDGEVGRRPVRLAGQDGRGRDDPARRRAGDDHRQGQHVDDADQAEGGLQPGQPADGRAGAVRHRGAPGPAQPGRAAAHLRARRTGCAAPRTWTTSSRAARPAGGRTPDVRSGVAMDAY